jgi:hypothetical protein
MNARKSIRRGSANYLALVGSSSLAILLGGISAAGRNSSIPMSDSLAPETVAAPQIDEACEDDLKLDVPGDVAAPDHPVPWVCCVNFGACVAYQMDECPKGTDEVKCPCPVAIEPPND